MVSPSILCHSKGEVKQQQQCPGVNHKIKASIFFDFGQTRTYQLKNMISRGWEATLGLDQRPIGGSPKSLKIDIKNHRWQVN